MVQAMLEDTGVEPAAATIPLLGVTYKANIAELRNAPSLAVAEHADDMGTTVYAVDPLVEEWADLEPMQPRTLDDVDADALDVVVLVTPHEEFTHLNWDAFEAPILDGRGTIDKSAVEGPVYTIGGQWP
jgi:UDP-N-acetyl-D-mannosaminuronic acid dehydrogenase